MHTPSLKTSVVTWGPSSEHLLELEPFEESKFWGAPTVCHYRGRVHKTRLPRALQLGSATQPSCQCRPDHHPEGGSWIPSWGG